MDYKKVLKSRKLRLKILELLSFVPDETMVRLQYRIKIGRKLNLTNPKRYTEKLQWYKLYYRDPLMVRCVDKYEVRKYVKKLGLGHILNECYGVFGSPDEIDFDKLPNQFVLKDTLGVGGNSVIICTDKSKADLNAYRAQMWEWVRTKNIPGGGREWVYYSGKKHRIIAEKYIECNEPGGLTDYKFFCFSGKPYCLYIMNERYSNSGAKQTILDMDFQVMPYMREHMERVRYNSEKPGNWNQMIEIAADLSKSFPYVRVDLYNVMGNILFGELTYFPGSGYYGFEPDQFDFELGKHFVLPNR